LFPISRVVGGQGLLGALSMITVVTVEGHLQQVCLILDHKEIQPGMAAQPEGMRETKIKSS
jgi:hypothetical protein